MAGFLIASLAGCRQSTLPTQPAAATTSPAFTPTGPAVVVTAPVDPGHVVEVTVEQLVDHPADYVGRTVSISGEIVVECSQGCWFFLDDGTGMIYIDLKPAGLAIPQKIGAQATVRGKIKGSGGNLQILGEAVEFPE